MMIGFFTILSLRVCRFWSVAIWCWRLLRTKWMISRRGAGVSTAKSSNISRYSRIQHDREQAYADPFQSCDVVTARRLASLCSGASRENRMKKK